MRVHTGDADAVIFDLDGTPRRHHGTLRARAASRAERLRCRARPRLVSPPPRAVHPRPARPAPRHRRPAARGDHPPLPRSVAGHRTHAHTEPVCSDTAAPDLGVIAETNFWRSFGNQGQGAAEVALRFSAIFFGFGVVLPGANQRPCVFIPQPVPRSGSSRRAFSAGPSGSSSLLPGGQPGCSAGLPRAHRPAAAQGCSRRSDPPPTAHITGRPHHLHRWAVRPRRTSAEPRGWSAQRPRTRHSRSAGGSLGGPRGSGAAVRAVSRQYAPAFGTRAVACRTRCGSGG